MTRIKKKLSRVKDLKAAIATLKKTKMRAGWPESAKYSDGTPVAGVAAVQEFGSPTMGVPPRPFMRTTAEAQNKAWAMLSEQLLREALNTGKDVRTVFDILGAKVAGDIKKTIAQMSSPELSQVTLALRKHKRSGAKITGALVGAVKQAVARGQTGPGQLGDSSGVSTKVLVYDAIMLNTLSHEVIDG